MAKVEQEQLLFEALLKKGQEAVSQGRLTEALMIFQSILKKKPDNVQTLNLHGQLCVNMGRADEARRSLDRATKLQPSNPHTWFLAALAQRMLSHPARAIDYIDRALRLRPNDAQYTSTKAEMLISAGEYAQAEALLTPLVASEGRNPVVAGVFGKLGARVGREKEAIDVVQTCLRGSMHPAPVRAMLCYILADLCDRTGQYDMAMEAAHMANAAKGARFDPVGFEAVVNAIISAWTRPYISTLPRPEMSSDRLVFLVGMPRSGMRVVEQVLGAHPDVFAAGELPLLGQMIRDHTNQAPAGLPVMVNLKTLNTQVISHHAATYLNHMKSLAPHAKRVLDRMPLGFSCLGYLQVLFPAARIIHVTRNPLDTCLSCYMQNFSGFLPYTNNLHYLGHFYRQYERLMEHWKRVLDMAMLELTYESLVTDTAAQARRMLDFIDLPFDENCLRSHEARRNALTIGSDVIRRPITDASVNRHRRYERHLQPLQAALGGPAPVAAAS